MANIGAGTGSSLSVTGNVQASNFKAGDSITANGIISSIGNIISSNNIAALNIVAGNTVGALGNVIGGNISTSGRIIATGNITGGNLFTTGYVSAQNTIIGPSLSITGNAIIGNLTVGTWSYGNISSTGYISASGNIRGSNISAAGNITSTGYINVSGNIIGGNIGTSGNITATGRVTANDFTATGRVTANAFIGNGSQLTGITGPAFIATQTIPQNLVYSPTVIQEMSLIYNSVSKNINSGYNPSTGIFTASQSGFYQVTGTIGANVNSYPSYLGAGLIGLYYNGTRYASGQFIQPITNPVTNTLFIDQSTVTTEIYLNSNDTVQCKFAYQTNAPTGYWNTGTNIIPGRFSAVWLRS